MGTTIRRQPVTNSIPKAPDYYYQNITNFSGIQETNNPFNADQNSASDSLNVYVDEENALTTRPRLALKKDLHNIFTNEMIFKNVHNLHNGYLVHGDRNFKYYTKNDPPELDVSNVTKGTYYKNKHNLPNDYLEVEYVEAGNRELYTYLEKGGKYKDYKKVYIDFQLTDISSTFTNYYYQFKTTQQNLTDGFYSSVATPYGEDGHYTVYNGGNWDMFYEYEGRELAVDTDRHVYQRLSPQDYYIDDIKNPYLIPNRANDDYDVGTMSIIFRNCRIYEMVFSTLDGTETIHLIPCIHNNVAGLYDIVNDEFHTPSRYSYSDYGSLNLEEVTLPNDYVEGNIFFEATEDIENPYEPVEVVGIPKKYYYTKTSLPNPFVPVLLPDNYQDDTTYYITNKYSYVETPVDSSTHGDYYVINNTYPSTWIKKTLPGDYKESESYLYFLEETEQGLQPPVEIIGDVPTTNCTVFEQNGIIYLLTGSNYLKIENNEISEVEGYVPTTVIGKTPLSNGNSYEDLNLLTPEYKESWLWHGEYDLSKLTNDFSKIINNYASGESVSIDMTADDRQSTESNLESIMKTYRLPTDSDEIIRFVVCPKDSACDYSKIIKFKLNCKTQQLTEEETIDLPTGVTLTDSKRVSCACSEYGDCFALCYHDGTNNIDKLFVRKNSWRDITSLLTNQVFATGTNNNSSNTIAMNRSGNKILVCNKVGTSSVASEWTLIDIDLDNSYSTPSQTAITETFTDNKSCLGVSFSEDSNLCFIKMTGAYDENDLAVFNSDISQSLTLTDDDLLLEDLTHSQITDISYNNGRLSTRLDVNTIRYYPNITDTSVYSDLKAKDWNDTNLIMASPKIFGDRLYTSQGYFDLSNENYPYINLLYDKIYFEPVIGTGFFKAGPSKTSNGLCYIDNNHIILTQTYSWARPQEGNGYRTTFAIYTLKEASTATVEIKHSLLDESEEDSEYWQENREKFLRSKLITRFDNNTWFAGDNNTFYTQYNDPTHIPVSSYNDLGESFDDITGFNVVSDTALVAYKNTRLYLITPTQVDNRLTYLYTETKNISGNNAIGAPIVTAYSNIPIHISYDGVYGLKQLENVQSTERVTELINEAINKRWINETKEAIESAKTINRLYWTYVVLPNNVKLDDFGEQIHFTKIYLFDNRTSSWYYWELPIVTKEVFVKNNEAEFVDSTGKIYLFSRQDLENEFNPDVTEYYDYGKKLIPWFWQSQILPLRTINYSKKLIDTTFILTDTDYNDEYALNYQFTAYRKNASQTTETTISDNLNYIQSTTKRTLVPRFNFIQVRLSNVEDDYDNNKLRLVGLALKYTLLNYNT